MSLSPLFPGSEVLGVWSIAHPLLLPGGLPLGTRTTVLRLPDGGLLLHSPGALSEDDRAQIAALGEVRVIFVPNREHTRFAAAALAAFPGAELHAPVGLAPRVGGRVHRGHAAAGGEATQPYGEGLFALPISDS